MLDPQDRTVLLDALSAPQGYSFDEGIGTTFSLDLISLLSVPLAFTQFEWDDTQGQISSNPVLLMEALRRHINRLTIFCQAGRIGVPKPPNSLFGFLEESVVEVTTGRPSGIFHPKVWALRYKNEETAEVMYRLLCLSRNLTNDRCWDLSLVLEGQLADRKNAYSGNHPLGRFFEALPNLALRSVSEAVRMRAQRIGAELRRVDFASGLPDPFEGIAFHPIGIEGHRHSPLPERWDRGLIISPFIDERQARYLPEGTAGSVLVSRREELDRLPKEALAEYAETLVLSPSADGEAEPEQDNTSSTEEPPRGLHAKLYVCEVGWNSHLFVGSANATTKAFTENVEFLIELVGRRSKVGIDQFLEPGEGQAALRNLLVRYEPPSVPVEEPVADQLEKVLDVVRSVMVSAGWLMRASGTQAGQWMLSLARPDSSPLPLPQNLKMRVWPITLPENSAARPLTAETRQIDFAEVSAATITSFLACEVEATIENLTETARFVLNLPLQGAPPHRREAILRLILDEPHKVLRFLQFLLDDGTSESIGLDLVSHPGNGAAGYRIDGVVILESLLRALAKEPARLDEVESVLRDLASDQDGQKCLPEGLMDVWPAIWQARELIRS